MHECMNDHLHLRLRCDGPEFSNIPRLKYTGTDQKVHMLFCSI